MSKRLRRTKIVTTLGPATDKDNVLEEIIKAGANVVRMNFSHGSAEDHILRAEKYATLRLDSVFMSPFSAIFKVLKSVFLPLKMAKSNSILAINLL